MALERERVRGHRVRPARRARWRSYAPAIAASLLGTLLVLAVEPIAEVGARATLGSRASLTLAAALAVLLVVVAAALCDRTPVRWYVSGALAVSLGANLAPVGGVGVPLIVLGLLGVLVREVQRAFDGLTLGIEGLSLHRPLKDPLAVGYEDVHAVHTTLTGDETGTLILETEHGTVTARDLPGVADLQARIEARTGSFEIDEPTQAAERARERIQSLVRGTASA